MAKRHLLADRQQPVRHVGSLPGDSDSESFRRAPHEQWISDRFRRCHQQQARGLRRQLRKPLAETLLDPSGQPLRAKQSEPTRQLGRVNPRGSSSSASGFPLVSATI
jgi:hypothetical protein